MFRVGLTNCNNNFLEYTSLIHVLFHIFQKQALVGEIPLRNKLNIVQM